MKKKLKGIVVAAATLALAAVMLAGCSGGGDAQKSDEGKAGDAPFTLTVGFDQGYPTATWAMTASSRASTWSLPRPCARRWAGS